MPKNPTTSGPGPQPPAAVNTQRGERWRTDATGGWVTERAAAFFGACPDTITANAAPARTGPAPAGPLEPKETTGNPAELLDFPAVAGELGTGVAKCADYHGIRVADGGGT